MQVKLMRMPRSGQTDMVVQTKFGTRIFELGKVEDLKDEEAAEIISGPFGACFETGGTAKVTAEGKAVVRQAQQTVKPDAEEAAAEEATKVVSSKDYKTK